MGDAIPFGNHLTDTTEELLINPLHTSIPQSIIKEKGTHSAASFAINHALPECSNSRLSLGGQSLGSEHGSSQDGGLLKEDGREARLGFKFQFTSREMDDKQLR